MPRRSGVLALPATLRDELNARLVANGFSGYEALSEWLEEQGYSLSKSALHRHGNALEADFEAAMSDVQRTTALARAWAKSDEDEQGDLLDATARMLQDALLRITIAMRRAEAAAEESDPAESAKTLSQVTRALADLGRMSIGQKKWAREVRERAQSIASDVAATARAGGLSDEAAEMIRQKILGVV